jgi:hypothetical protein
MPPPITFTEADLRRWQEQGLITQEQLEAILAAERERQAERPAAEVEQGLNLVTILYYVGVSLALVALGVFAGTNWEDIPRWGRVAITIAAMIGIGGAGLYINRRTPYVRGGGILVTVSATLIPLVLFSLGDAVAGRESETFIDDDHLGRAVGLQAISLALITVSLIRTRIAMVSLAVAGQVIALAGTGAAWWLGTDDGGIEIAWVMAGAGAALLIVGGILRWRVPGEYGFWFNLPGHITFLYAFTWASFEPWGVGYATLYVAVYAAMLLLSVPLRDRLYAAAGAIGIYIFITRLIVDAFEGSPFLPLGLALVGLSMVGLAIGYQQLRHRYPAVRAIL